MMIICAVILLLPLVRGLMRVALMSLAQRQAMPLAAARDLDLCLLIPAYREQLIMSDTAAWFAHLIEGFRGVTVVLITTEREERERAALARWVEKEGVGLNKTEYLKRLRGRFSNCDEQMAVLAFDEGLRGQELSGITIKLPTTANVVRETLNRMGNQAFRHVQYSGKSTGKSAQLNYALKKLSPLAGATDRAYVAVFDCDARPQKDSIRDLTSTVLEDDYPHAVQQPVLPLLAMCAASPGAVADALLHVVRAYADEVWVWRVSRRFISHPWVNQLLFDFYFVGSGLYLRLDVLHTAGGFPSPVDDIPLGFAAAREGWRIAVMQTPCLTQAYPRLRSAASSRTLVFLAYWDHLHGALRKPMYLLSGTARETLTWCIGPWVWMAALLYMAFSSGAGIALLLAAGSPLAYWLLLVAGAKSARRFHAHHRSKELRVIMIAPFYAFWRSFSALLLLGRILRTKFGIGELVFTKTERIKY